MLTGLCNLLIYLTYKSSYVPHNQVYLSWDISIQEFILVLLLQTVFCQVLIFKEFSELFYVIEH